MSTKILITGGSGLVGSALSEKLEKLGYQVYHLSRSSSNATSYSTFSWDISRGLIEQGAFEEMSHIVHLAGAGVADKKWTQDRKKELAASRIDSANLLFDHLKRSEHKIKSFISASAIGIYGFDTGGILQTEDRIQLGDDFLATLTKKWEAAADQFQDLGARVVKVRIGLVLSKKGGLLEKLVPVTRLGLGAAFGSGEQYMSWIHIDDLVDIIVRAIENAELEGAYNAVAPNPVTNKEFIATLAGVLNKPYFLPGIPKFVLKLGLGELSSALTGGNRVSSEKITKAGYEFHFKELENALKDLLIEQ
jgi:uncharacterized protein (TIGR01777 family)